MAEYIEDRKRNWRANRARQSLHNLSKEQLIDMAIKIGIAMSTAEHMSKDELRMAVLRRTNELANGIG